ncbi:hypothetical protein KY386_02580 [Candidatus Parcubacteria bacterium]|nr:hypothetical protein [Candidatus Parcubacteria bacterium]
MKSKLKVTAVAALMAVGVGLVATSAVSARHQDEARPGWGFGDRNHVHTGPPGQSVRVDSNIDVNVSTRVNQSARSGNASSSNNTSGGSATSGSASNSSSASSSVGISN